MKEQTRVVQFYKFPNTKYESIRRPAWIRFCARKNADGSDWQPTNHSRICSEHFVGGRHVNNINHPSFLPTIHPVKTLSKGSVVSLDRFERSLNRSTKKSTSHSHHQQSSCSDEHFEESTSAEDYLSTLNFKLNKETNTESMSKDASSGKDYKVSAFFAYDSVLQMDSFQSFTGVSKDVFNMLLRILTECGKPYKPRVYRLEDMLLMFLYKLKSNCTFSDLAVLFEVIDKPSEIDNESDTVQNCDFSSSSESDS
ncbi:hypothetical protein BLOT_016559 [Blomia tropicalis]|nr:hypothetical protein BLOT_016559 [Blomia tropicalis]